MKKMLAFLLFLCALSSCSEKKIQTKHDFVVAQGQMPNMVKDKDNNIHLVYGSGDSILYCYSSDNAASFSKPALVSVLPHVYTFATRGPQIAATEGGIVITACTSLGNIYSFYKENEGAWVQGKRVNDVDTIAKEGLMALSADGNNAFAVWLDVRGNKRNKIYGAKSSDGGKIWSKNVMVYTSPDTTVCECCKPSVAVKGSNVYVMFRNWLQGSRDLYLAQSSDGNHFDVAKKLGIGTWKLNGCPMDGGGLAVDEKGMVQTVWRRESKVYAAMPNSVEKEIGQGRGCTLETVDGKNVYAWTDNGDIVIMKPGGQSEVLGKGSLPVLKALDNQHIACVWENEKQIHAAIVQL
ncbi:exo-alpha-sialidase [Ilyomonas limi]|uniref:Exo-alpha-sialidase n=1 Tax=Ilyomonas limi TaxID=2575867 RepID=A0A4U3KVB4_9BACT|nr:sialidase family protein [Ilyomonas limi]TKK66282.1 exo-alpha-sialidase [Ilyomonas limi]